MPIDADPFIYENSHDTVTVEDTTKNTKIWYTQCVAWA